MANTQGAIFGPSNMPRNFSMTPKTSMGLPYQRHLGHSGSWYAGDNYSYALECDKKTAKKIMAVIKAAERKINQELAKVNDTAAFDMIEIAGCFDYLKEATPSEQVLEERAG